MKKIEHAGFTLIEVMVALAVVALALPAVILSLYQQVDGTEHLRDKSFAQMVASNKLAELRLLNRARGRLFSGSDSGTEELAGRSWAWTIESEKTQMQSFLRLEIQVRPGDDPEAGLPLYTLVAFLHESQENRESADALSGS